MLNWPHPEPDRRSRLDGLTLSKARPRKSEGWIAAAILLVTLLGLLVGRDTQVSEYLPGPRRTTVAIPPRPADVAVLLTNTPLAIAPEDALAINAARPVDRLRISAARPFLLPFASRVGDVGVGAALDCLTKAVYYEAAVENDAGQRAVAQVVLNRMRSPIFPHTVCGVVFQGSELKTGCQFSFTCDGSLMRRPSLTGWMRARRIALAALSGQVEPSVGLATHYHANYVVPYWASSLDKVSTIGAHIFYTMRGSLGRSSGFGAAYDRLAEAVPTLSPSIDPIDGLAPVDGTGAVDPLTGVKPQNRTLVTEDMRGELVAPGATAPVAPTAGLRADEHESEIAADRTKGELSR